jgi:hypothetical protein
MVTILTSCSVNKQDSFRKDALEIAKLIRNAFNLKQSESTTSIDDKNLKIVINSNINKSLQYLEKEKERMDRIYSELYVYIEIPNTKNYDNAILICTVINQSLLLLSSDSYENYSKILNKYKKISVEKIDSWVINDFYREITIPKKYHNDWKSMKNKEKLQIIFEGVEL